MTKIKPEDHPDFIGGWKWTKLELDWINERIGTLESALFQSQEAAKDLASQLAKKETLLNEAMWSYGELKREQLANQAKTSSSPIEDWEAVAADQAMTIALLKAEQQRAAWAGLTDEQITAGARALCKQMAEACGVDVRDQWQLYSDTFKEDAKAVLEAATASRGKHENPTL